MFGDLQSNFLCTVMHNHSNWQIVAIPFLERMKLNCTGIFGLCTRTNHTKFEGSSSEMWPFKCLMSILSLSEYHQILQDLQLHNVFKNYGNVFGKQLWGNGTAKSTAEHAVFQNDYRVAKLALKTNNFLSFHRTLLKSGFTNKQSVNISSLVEVIKIVQNLAQSVHIWHRLLTPTWSPSLLLSWVEQNKVEGRQCHLGSHKQQPSLEAGRVTDAELQPQAERRRKRTQTNSTPVGKNLN